MNKKALLEMAEFFCRYPELSFLQEEIVATIDCIMKFGAHNKILICGNGGSSADSEHIVGELMKEFKVKRSVDPEFSSQFIKLFGEDDTLLSKLQGAVPAISLSSHTALSTAIINDIGAEYMFAQQAYAYCNSGDVLFALSTSGNSKAVINATKVCKACGGTVVGFTGRTGGQLKEYCDILLNAPETETYKVQELHLPLYHLICALVEIERFAVED